MSDKTVNQCDGCRAGIPVDSRGFHRFSERLFDAMLCQAYKYDGADPMSDQDKLKAAADVLLEQFGDCADDDFCLGCITCWASHVRRVMLEEPTPHGDKAIGWVNTEIVRRHKAGEPIEPLDRDA